MIVTCSDSRINPALLLNAQSGELFIARNIGNVVPPYLPTNGRLVRIFEKDLK